MDESTQTPTIAPLESISKAVAIESISTPVARPSYASRPLREGIELLPKTRVSCVIPAFNEGKAIAEVIVRLRDMYPDFELLVVDDGSSDNTAEVAEAAGARVIRHTYNIGNGAAVKTGIRNATGNVIVMLDADGQHPPEEISRLVEHIGPYDMVVGARSSMAKVSKFRSFGNWGLIRIAEFLTEKKIPDLTSGFRAVKKDR